MFGQPYEHPMTYEERPMETANYGASWPYEVYNVPPPEFQITYNYQEPHHEPYQEPYHEPYQEPYYEPYQKPYHELYQEPYYEREKPGGEILIMNKYEWESPEMQAYPFTNDQFDQLPVFHGLEEENPLMFIRSFEKVIFSFPRFVLTLEDLERQLFRFSLHDRAWHWFLSLEPDSLTTWDSMFDQFMSMFYGPFVNRYDPQYLLAMDLSPNAYNGVWETWLKDEDNKCTSPEAQEEINETPFPSHDILFMTIGEKELTLTNAKEEFNSVSFHEETKIPMPLEEFVYVESLFPPPIAVSHLEEEVVEAKVIVEPISLISCAILPKIDDEKDEVVEDELVVVDVEEFVDPFLEDIVVAILIPKSIGSPGGHFTFLKLVCELPAVIPKELLRFCPHLVFPDDYSRFRPPKVIEVRKRAHDSYLSVIPTYEPLEEKSITTSERRYYNIKLKALFFRRTNLFIVINYSRLRPPKQVETFISLILTLACRARPVLLLKNTKAWHDRHLFLDPG